MDRCPTDSSTPGGPESHGAWLASWVGAILIGLFVGGPLLGAAWMLLVVAPVSWLAGATAIPLAAVMAVYLADLAVIALLARGKGRALRRMFAGLAG